MIALANPDPAIEIAENFEKLSTKFEVFYQGHPVKVRTLGSSYDVSFVKDAELLAFTPENSKCKFHVCFGENDEHTMEPDRVNIDANEVDSANFQAFIKDVNDCIDDFDIILRNEKCLIYHEDYGIWIEAEIIDVHLSSSCYYHVNYNRHFSGSGKVLARNVRLNHSFCSCGSYVPRDYLKKHRDCAVHLGHALTKVYLRFLAEYKGLEVTVRGQQATLEETCKPWLDENIRFRLKLIENGEEIEESFQNIDCGHQCIVCRKVFTGAEIVCHLETHFYGLNVGPLVGNDVLAQMSRDLIEKFQQFDWGLKKAQAIVHDEEHFEEMLITNGWKLKMCAMNFGFALIALRLHTSLGMKFKNMCQATLMIAVYLVRFG
ncbi:uncharacterized protein LOC129568059 isoform X2 [Sitodiplosis mosellana]|uniref:uncharacterized protein LOC129568059 isoform X2 n=1 Tax=Sitodiplosis mosellana TaxID=263140 RepID=UPI002443D619|nr:uncharacterized protein LOC129568059 isoform X2 [Sitodiplosis mosellana]